MSDITIADYPRDSSDELRRRAVFLQQKFGAVRCWQVSPWVDSGVVHGFLGADLDFRDGASVLEFEQTVLNSLAPVTPPLRLALLDQVHGVELKRCDADFLNTWNPGSQPRDSRPQADGWLARNQVGYSNAVANPASCGGIALGILTADCLPVLIRCTQSGSVAALHCGWRSAIGGLLPITLQELLSGGSTSETLEVAIGPGASVEQYQVGPEVAAEFQRAAAKLVVGERKSVPVVRELVSGTGETKFFLDISRLLIQQARAVGLKLGNIFCFDGCTIAESCFFSFRREKDSSGRQLSFITQHLVKK